MSLGVDGGSPVAGEVQGQGRRKREPLPSPARAVGIRGGGGRGGRRLAADAAWRAGAKSSAITTGEFAVAELGKGNGPKLASMSSARLR